MPSKQVEYNYNATRSRKTPVSRRKKVDLETEAKEFQAKKKPAANKTTGQDDVRIYLAGQALSGLLPGFDKRGLEPKEPLVREAFDWADRIIEFSK